VRVHTAAITALAYYRCAFTIGAP